MNFNLIQPQPDGNLTAVLVFMGKTYNLCQFSTTFEQPSDEKGEPQAEVRGGKLLVVLSQIPDDNLSYWASNQWSRKDGEIAFRNETGTPPLRITFKEAYCIGLTQEINQGVKTSLLISLKSIQINGVSTLNNNWVD